MKQIVTLGMIAFFSLLSLNGNADDAKNYNASSCIAFSGDGKRLSFSNIYNTSSSSILRADCVATKDTIGKSIKKAWIEVKDLSSAEDVRCQLVSHYNNVGSTNGAMWSQTKKTSGINSNWQRLNYTGVGANSGSHYYFSCSVPKRTGNGASWLGTYQITENT